MATQRKQKAKGLPKRTGKRAGKIQSYYASVWPMKKLRNLLKNNGIAAATAWARKFEYEHLLARVKKVA